MEVLLSVTLLKVSWYKTTGNEIPGSAHNYPATQVYRVTLTVWVTRVTSSVYRCIYQRKQMYGRGGRLVEEKNQRLEEKTILDDILDENIYDARIRPSSLNSSDGPTNIQVNLMIRSIDKIDDVKMEFSTQITFRLKTI